MQKLTKDEFLALPRTKQVAYTKQRLAESDSWLVKGLVTIYERQTAAEQQVDQTRDLNGVGFGAFDAEFLSSSARRVLEGKFMTEKHIAAIRRTMLKYAGQLVKVARGEV